MQVPAQRLSRYSSPPSVRPSAASMARGTVFCGLREAALELWGADGLATLAACLPADVKATTVDSFVVSVGWYPESYVMSWFIAAHERMSNRDDRQFFRFLDRMMDHGFGRIRRTLLRLASPNLVLAQATSLWRHDHSHGQLEATVGRGHAQLTLTNHVYTTDPVSRSAIAEIYRYGVAMTGVKQVISHHSLTEPECLQVTLRWAP